MRSKVNIALAMLVLLSSLLGTGVAGAVAGTGTGVQFQQEANETTTPGPNSPPTSAEVARVTPVDMGVEFLNVEVRDGDAAFNTSGPVAQFEVSEPLDSVRIQQSPADARLTGSHVVTVNYEADAAPLDTPSLYTLELYFEDGSSKTIDLYATETSVNVGSGELQMYRDLIVTMRQDAEDHGFEPNPDGTLEYHEYEKERADILDNMFSEKAVQALMTLIMWVTNPIALLLTLFVIIAGLFWRVKTHGWALDAIRNDPGRASRMLRELKLAYKENQDSAASDRLENIHEIGSDERKWRASHGVATVIQLADLFHYGAWDADGDKIHDGVDDLLGTDPHDTWLEPILRDGRLSNPEIAIVQGIKALERMETKYGMGHVYRDTRERLDKYQTEVQNDGLKKRV